MLNYLVGLFTIKTQKISLRLFISMKMLEVKLHLILLDIGSRLYFIKKLIYSLSANVLIVGYRGYGKSEGIPTEQGLMLDAESTMEYTFNDLRKKFDLNINKIFVLGRSLGGAVAIYVLNNFKYRVSFISLYNFRFKD